MSSAQFKRVPSNESVKRSLDINNNNANANSNNLIGNTPNSLRLSREVGKSPGKIFSFDKNTNVAHSVAVSSSSCKSNIMS